MANSTRNINAPVPLSVLWLLAAAAALYLLYPAAVLECDAVIYSCAAVAGDLVQSTDAGHLAWGFVEMAAARLGRAFEPPLGPVYLLRWLAIASALAGGWLFHRLARRTGSAPGAAWLITGLLLFCYSYWHFGVQAESHLVAAFFLIAFASAAAEHFRTHSTATAVAAAGFLSLSTLMHQTGILFAPAFLLPAWWTAGRGRERRRVAAAFLGVYFLGVVVPYLGVGWFVRGFRSYAEYRDWILGLSLWGLWGDWETTSGVAAAIGVGRSIVGSHYLLGIPWIERLAYRVVPLASWQDEVALAATVPPLLRYALFVLEAVWFAALVAGLIRLRGRLPRLWRDRNAFSAFLALWSAVYVPFIVWWAPIRGEFWIAAFVPLLLLLGPVLAIDDSHRARAGAALLVTCLAALNLGGSLAPQSRDGVEPELRPLLGLDARARAGDFVLCDTDLRGRATRFVYDLDKIDLLDPQPWRTSRLPAASQGAPAPGRYEEARLPLPAPVDPTDPDGRSLAAIAAALQVAADEGHEVWLAMEPLTRDPLRMRTYAALLPRIGSEFELSAPVPVRGGVEWRRVVGRLSPPPRAASDPAGR